MVRDFLFFHCRQDKDGVLARIAKEELQIGGDPAANLLAVFPDPAGKDEQVQTPEQSSVTPDCLTDRGAEGVDCQCRAGIFAFHFLQQCLHVGFAPRKAAESTILVNQSLQRLDTQVLIAQHVQKDAGVAVAAARPHRHAAGRTEAHGGIDRPAIAHGGYAGAAPKMRND